MRPVKFNILAGELENMISSREIAAGKQIPSQSQIVKQFKVSRSCVNKALNLLQRKGLISTIPGKGTFAYSPDIKPRTLKRLAYLTDTGMRRYRGGYDDYGLEVMCGIEEECKKRKISFTFRSLSPEEYPHLPVIVKELEVDGVIIRNTIPETHVNPLASIKIPVVYEDTSCHASGIGCTMVNYHDAYMTLVEKLKSNGIKKISFFYPGTSRYGMEIKSSIEHIRLMHPELEIMETDFSVPGKPYDANKDMEVISNAVGKIIKKRALPELFVCNTDYIAEKLMIALNENGLKIPSDVQLIGGLGLPFAEKTNPPISSLYVNPEQLGRKTVETLYEMVINGTDEKIERIPMSYKKGGTCVVL